MGNVLCRHKGSSTSSTAAASPTATVTHNAGQQQQQSPAVTGVRSPFDRILARVQLCPSSLHNRPDHNKKTCNKCENNKKETPAKKITKQTGLNNEKELKIQNQSTDWQDANLEAASLQEIKSIFADLINPHTPIPPPRRHRQKLIEQTYNDIYSHKEPVYEEPCIKTTKKKHICKIDEERFYKQHVKHHSTVSLPNINELQLSIAKEDQDDPSMEEIKQRNSAETQSIESKKIGRLENYMMRCRSFGSLLPNKLVDKLKLSRRINSETAESDDSWGGLEDWDLGVIEHYKPHDNSLPRPVNKNKINEYAKPIPPVRKTDSLLRKHRKENLTESNKNFENEQRNSGLKLVDIPTEILNSSVTETKNKENEQRNGLKDIPKENLNNNTVKESYEEIKRADGNSDLKLAESSLETSVNEHTADDSDKIFKPTICFEEKKKITTPPPTPEIIIPTISPAFVNTETSDHSTLMKLITEIASNDESSELLNQKDDDSKTQQTVECENVSLSDIFDKSKMNNSDNGTQNPLKIPKNEQAVINS